MTTVLIGVALLACAVIVLLACAVLVGGVVWVMVILWQIQNGTGAGLRQDREMRWWSM